jgi:hypothetical protein
MAVFAQILKWVVQKFWPWFVEFVWPFIKEHVKDLLNFLLEKLKGIFKERFSKNQEKRSDEATEKAEKADKMAGESESQTEAQKHKATANVWREVAAQYRRDNEDLQREFDNQAKLIKNLGSELVDKTKITANFANNETIITVGENSKSMPTLAG